MCDSALYPGFKILLVFLIVFSSQNFYIKERFYIKWRNVLWCCNCFEKNEKILLKITNRWVQDFLRCESKYSGQSTAAVRFFFGKWQFPAFEKRTIG